MIDMKLPTCSRKLHICTGHRVHGHESKCAHLHGHNYVIWVTAVATNPDSALDDVGRVIDFSVLKEVIGGWLEEYWDHKFLMWEDDPKNSMIMPDLGVVLVPFNPTAENMAVYLLELANGDLLTGTGVRLTQVVVHETENCYATATTN